MARMIGIQTMTRTLYSVGAVLILIGLCCFGVSVVLTTHPNLLETMADYLSHPLSGFLRFPEHTII